MSQTCGVCRHQDRMDIDRELLGLAGPKLTQVEIARKYGLGRGTIQRHVSNNHVSRVMSAVAEEVTILHGNGLLQEIASLYETTQRIMSRAEHADDLKTAVSAIREARGCIETFAKIGLALAKDESDEDDGKDRSRLDDAIDDALAKRHKRLAISAPADARQDDDTIEDAEIVTDGAE